MRSRQRPDSPAACRLAQRSGAHSSGSADHVGHRQGRGPLPRLSSRLARDILSTVAQRPASHPVGPVRRARSSVGPAHGLFAFACDEGARPAIQGVIVGGAQGGRAGQGGHRIHPEGIGQRGDRTVTNSAAPQGTTVRGAPRPVDRVRRVLDGSQPHLLARARRIGTAQAQQGAQPRHPILVASNRRNRAQRRGTRAARQAQQHRLSLVLHRVPQQHGPTLAQGHLTQGGNTRLAGRGLGTSRSVDAHRDGQRARTQAAGQIRDAASLLRTTGPQAMIDRHRHHIDTRARRHINRGQGQRQRIRTTRQAHDERGRHPGLVDERTQTGAHRERTRPHTAPRIHAHEAGGVSAHAPATPPARRTHEP